MIWKRKFIRKIDQLSNRKLIGAHLIGNIVMALLFCRQNQKGGGEDKPATLLEHLCRGVTARRPEEADLPGTKLHHLQWWILGTFHLIKDGDI